MSWLNHSMTRLFTTALTIFGLWMIGGILVTGFETWKLGAFAQLEIHPADAVLLGLARGSVWALITPLIIFTAYHVPIQRPHRLRRFALLIPIVLLLALGRELMGTVIFQLIEGRFWDPRELIAAWLLRLDVNVAIVAGLVGLGNVLRVQRENRERQRIAAELEAEVNRAQLRQLRSDLQPHFLFNALNGIMALVHPDPDRADSMLMTLSQLLRRSLEIRTVAQIPLEEELGIASDYLELMKMRFGDRLWYAFEADDDLMQIPIPPLLLQPLVENAVKHGALADGDRAEILLRAFREDGSVRIQVIDSGPAPRTLPSSGEGGVGLSATRRRLELLYGQDAWLRLRSEDGRVVSDVCIPADRQLHERPAKTEV